jgi:protein-S-isoprenylcysteine O-methyltransferase Ste14
VNVLLYLVIWTAWAVLHSLLMTPAAKGWFQRLLGPRFAFYRLGFIVLAVFSFGLAGLAAPRLPLELYAVSAPWSWGLRLVQTLGLVLLVWTFFVIDGQEFLGLAQVRAFLRQGPGPDASGERPGRLLTSGPYGLCRHPMYLAGLMILFAAPRMTLEHLLFSLFAAAYFLVGSIFEEQRLVLSFGDAYLQYRRRTSRIFPLSFPGNVVERGPS